MDKLRQARASMKEKGGVALRGPVVSAGLNVRVVMDDSLKNKRELGCFVQIPCMMLGVDMPILLVLSGLVVPVKFSWSAAVKCPAMNATKTVEDGLNSIMHRNYTQTGAVYALEDGIYARACKLLVHDGKRAL